MFLAIYDLIVRQEMQVNDRDKLVEVLRNSAEHIVVQGGGGRWGAENRKRAVNGVIGQIQSCFGPMTQVDPAKVYWITQLQNILSQSYTEQSAYDFKQGFLKLDDKPAFDDKSFEKILKTLVGISNLGRNRIGYVLVGVADDAATAVRVEQITGAKPLLYQNFFITGVDHEVVALGKSHDEMFQWITDKVRQSKISDNLRDYIASNIKPVRYHDKTIYVFEAKGMAEPSTYGDKYYERRGAQLEELTTTHFASLFKRYM